VPLETRYHEVYNRPNVRLIDINETPIERIAPKGIEPSDAEYEFDIIIYATGFDAITGSFDRIDIRGVDECRLKDIMIEGFPNLLMVIGPHAGLGNFPRAAKYSVECVTGLVRFAHDRRVTRVETTAAGVVEWTEHVLSLGQGLLMNEIDSWMTGVNRNVEGKQTRKIMRYRLARK
jgi:cation diffusion facilitator CzcD-associated flavoprotein CzcO